jgi:hypothetical protein
MKYKITDAPKDKELPYPKLMKSNNGKIVLMTVRGEGMVLFDEGYTKAGHYSNEWIMHNFSDFHGTIALSNH